MRRGFILGSILFGVLTVLPSVSHAEVDSPSAPRKAGLECETSLLGAYPIGVPAWDPQRPLETVYDWAENRSDVHLGIGHLRGSGRFLWGDRQLRLPLYLKPGGASWGWFVNGWLVEPESRGAARAVIGAQGMVETEYEATSFIVFEVRPDGWLRFRYGKPAAGRDGTAWLHRCHLARESVVLERWEDRFLGGEISPLFFRRDVPRALLAGPHDEERRVIWIANDYHLEPLGFKGDWMHVLVKQPSDYCAAPEGVKTKVYEGWVRWRSPDHGPMVWYHTRGC